MPLACLCLHFKRGCAIKRRWIAHDLAAAIGIAAHSYINALETGKKKPTIELVMQLAKLFGVSADQLLDDARDLDAPRAGANSTNTDAAQ